MQQEAGDKTFAFKNFELLSHRRWQKGKAGPMAHAETVIDSLPREGREDKAAANRDYWYAWLAKSREEREKIAQMRNSTWWRERRAKAMPKPPVFRKIQNGTGKLFEKRNMTKQSIFGLKKIGNGNKVYWKARATAEAAERENRRGKRAKMKYGSELNTRSQNSTKTEGRKHILKGSKKCQKRYWTKRGKVANF